MTESLSSSLNKLMLTLALLAGFFVSVSTAQAATIFGPDGAIVGVGADYSAGPIDARGFTGLQLTFEYAAETLDTGDSFIYGWRSGAEEVLGSFNGLPEGTTAVPGDETGTISVSLPETAAVSELELFVRVSANSTVSNDNVEIKDLILTGDEVNAAPDTDGDEIADNVDNCPLVSNPDQADFDVDDVGDPCDGDDDGDGVLDAEEIVGCTFDPSLTCGIVIDTDEDNDGFSDDVDNCPFVTNADQVDTDVDGKGDVCDDEDGDGVLDIDEVEGCVTDPDPLCGVATDPDTDGDGVTDPVDNCPLSANLDQIDHDADGLGDACDTDDDGDDILDNDESEGCELDQSPSCGVSTDIDTDGDGVTENDRCLGTTVDAAGSTRLNPNHLRYDGSVLVKALVGNGKKNMTVYTMTDTQGCSCDQMLDILSAYTRKDYGGQWKFGCTAGTIEEFMGMVW